jgi:hypothetical protein
MASLCWRILNIVIYMSNIPRVGERFNSYCNGMFGRDEYGEKRVEAVGCDWIMVRTENNYPVVGYFRGGLEAAIDMFESWRAETRERDGVA